MDHGRVRVVQRGQPVQLQRARLLTRHRGERPQALLLYCMRSTKPSLSVMTSPYAPQIASLLQKSCTSTRVPDLPDLTRAHVYMPAADPSQRARRAHTTVCPSLSPTPLPSPAALHADGLGRDDAAGLRQRYRQVRLLVRRAQRLRVPLHAPRWVLRAGPPLRPPLPRVHRCTAMCPSCHTSINLRDGHGSTWVGGWVGE